MGLCFCAKKDSQRGRVRAGVHFLVQLHSKVSDHQAKRLAALNAQHCPFHILHYTCLHTTRFVLGRYPCSVGRPSVFSKAILLRQNLVVLSFSLAGYRTITHSRRVVEVHNAVADDVSVDHRRPGWKSRSELRKSRGDWARHSAHDPQPALGTAFRQPSPVRPVGCRRARTTGSPRSDPLTTAFGRLGVAVRKQRRLPDLGHGLGARDFV